MSLAAAISGIAAGARAPDNEQLQFKRAMAVTDYLLRELELLNLSGVSTPPARLAARVVEAAVTLPAGAGDHLCLSTVQVTMDSVYAAQDCLLRWRDPQRPPLDDDEG
jgi:hypothetical protein